MSKYRLRMGNQTRFCEGGRWWSCPLTRASIKRAPTVKQSQGLLQPIYIYYFWKDIALQRVKLFLKETIYLVHWRRFFKNNLRLIKVTLAAIKDHKEI